MGLAIIGLLLLTLAALVLVGIGAVVWAWKGGRRAFAMWSGAAAVVMLLAGLYLVGSLISDSDDTPTLFAVAVLVLVTALTGAWAWRRDD